MARLDWSRQKYYIEKWLKFKEKKKERKKENLLKLNDWNGNFKKMH